MRQFQNGISIATKGQGLHEFTGEARQFVEKSAVTLGELTVFIQHTSASLLIQENAAPDVRRDLDEFFCRLVPEDTPWFRHREEGPDDMPAHIKAALMQSSLTIPVSNGDLALGIWQGLFLFEHRSRPHQRQILLHLIGD
jgi:secondary thiamine-phosphate synthase enzyme